MRPKILVVSMAMGIRATARKLLLEIGCEVETTPTCDQALSILPSYDANIVMTDRQTHNTDAEEFIRQIRKDKRKRWIIVMVGTTLSEKEKDQVIQTTGADDVIRKPFDIEEIEAAINAVTQTALLQ